MISQELHAREGRTDLRPKQETRTLSLAESNVAPIRTALGFTTMLNFDVRPSSVILGDQDAFKIEYAGNGLAIKPVIARAKTNLFVFTDYDRFSFQLIAGPQNEADYAIHVKGKRPYSEDTPDKADSRTRKIEKMIVKKIGSGKVCDGFELTVDSIAWERNGGTYQAKFGVRNVQSEIPVDGLHFQPGDFDVFQNRKSLPIENLYLDGLVFTKQLRKIQGTLVLAEANLKKGAPLVLIFSPDFLKNKNRCLSVPFSRRSVSSHKKTG